MSKTRTVKFKRHLLNRYWTFLVRLLVFIVEIVDLIPMCLAAESNKGLLYSLLLNSIILKILWWSFSWEEKSLPYFNHVLLKGHLPIPESKSDCETRYKRN